MVAELVTLPDMEEVDLMETDRMRTLVKQLIEKITQNEKAAEAQEEAKFDDSGQQNKVNGFRDKNISKPDPWDGEDEAGFKTWSERLTVHMAGAGDKVWKKIIKYVNEMDEEESLENEEEVDDMLEALKVNTDLKDDLQDMLYDQLTQYTKKELLSDIQMAGPSQCFESLRKAMAYGKKKTAENIHRARNRVTRPEIAENMTQLEERYRSWKKDIAYLKEIGAYDFKDQTMISILMDFVPDEVHKEISMKHDTVGRKAASLKTIQLMTEKIIQREKDRIESRKDRKKAGKVSAVGEREQHHHHHCGHGHDTDQGYEKQEMFVWDQHTNGGYGGFVAAAMKRGRDGDDEADADTEAAQKRMRPEEDGGKAKGKSKGKGKADRECFQCGEKGHYKAQCPNRWYVPKTQWNSWWSTLPFQKGKGKGKGKGYGDDNKGKGKGKGMFKGQGKGMGSLEHYEPEAQWQDETWGGAEGGWNLIGAVSKARAPRKEPQNPVMTKTENKFNALKSEDETPEENKSVKVCTVDLIKEKFVKRKPTEKKRFMPEKECKCHTIIKVSDEKEIDKIIAEHRKKVKEDESKKKIDEMIGKNVKMNETKVIAGLTMKNDTLAACAEKVNEWTKISMAVDSGACESVIDAFEQVPGYEVRETKASKSGLVYASATGEEIPNLGEVMLPMLTKENTKRSMKMQAAEVSRPLASVKRICEAGHVVVFDEDGSFIYNKTTGEFNQLREESGNYMFDVWVPPKEAVANFRWQ